MIKVLFWEPADMKEMLNNTEAPWILCWKPDVVEVVDIDNRKCVVRPWQINTMVYGFWGLKSLRAGDLFFVLQKTYLSLDLKG